MNIPSLYSSRAFYDTTSALNGIPFANPSTCGVMGTMRDQSLGANLASCGLGAYPDYGNIGYANRIYSVGGWEDLWDAAKQGLGNVIDRLADPLNQVVDALVGQGQRKLLESQGYVFLEPVEVTYKGALTQGMKVKNKNGQFEVLLKNGSLIPFTSDIAAVTRRVDLKTGLTTGQTAGIAIAVAAVALVIILSRRR
jgi:hypothetical protein